MSVLVWSLLGVSLSLSHTHISLPLGFNFNFPTSLIRESPCMRVVKGIFVTRDRPFFFSMKCEMANFFPVNRDFNSSREAWFCKIIFRETRNKCLIRREPWFSWRLCDFRQPLLRNKWYCVTVTGQLIPVATTWLVWFSVIFGQPSFSSSVLSISTIMAEAHQRNVRDFFLHRAECQVDG